MRRAPARLPGNQALLRLQRKCFCGGAGTCDACVRRRTDETRNQPALDHVERVIGAQGAPLAPSLRMEFQNAFDADFSRVHVHTDSSAALSARALRARAFTHGQQIVFGEGQYRPETSDGRRLIAHELAHTIQQSRGGPAPAPFPGAAHERAADAAATAFARGKRPVRVAGATGIGITRDPRFLAQDYPPAGLTDEQLRYELELVRAFLRDPGISASDAMRARRALGRLQVAWDAHHPQAAAAQRYNLTLVLDPRSPRAFENLTRGQAMMELRNFRGNVNARYEGGLEGHRDMRRIREDQWIVGSVSDVLGGVQLPPESIWQPVQSALAEGDRAYTDSDVVAAAQAYQRAANEARRAQRRVYEYREGTISGAERAQTGLEVVQVAAAATVTIGTGGTAGLLVGAAYGGAQQLAGQATEVHLGLRDRIDWAGIGFDTLFGLVTGYLGGRLGNAVLGRLLRNPATASLGRQALANVTSDLVAGRVASVLHSAGRMVFDQLRGQEDITPEIFVDRLAAQLADPRGAFLDVIMGAAYRRTTARRPTAGSGTPTPPTQTAPSPRPRAQTGPRPRRPTRTQRLAGRLVGATMQGIVEAAPITGGTGGGSSGRLVEPAAISARAAPEPTTQVTSAPHAEPAAPHAEATTPPAQDVAPAPEPGQGVVRQAPEVAAGFARQHVARLGGMLGRAFTSGPLARVAAVWNSVANPGEAARLTRWNSRRLFDNHRARFWRRVRRDPQLMQLFTDAGLTFGPGETSAPYYQLPNGRRVQITIDHVNERQTHWGQALDPGNLQFSFRLENVTLLRLIHALDPFQ